MVLHSNKRKCEKIETEDNRTLYLIEPGYFLNQDLYFIYSQINDSLEYNQLLDNLGRYLIGDRTVIDSKVLPAIRLLHKKGLIEIDGDIPESCGSTLKVLNEFELGTNFNFFPITQLDLVVTKKCNYNCKHCFINFDKEVAVSMKLNDWISFIQKAKVRGLQTVVITGGEPLMVSFIVDLIKYLALNSIRVVFLTNGYLFDDSIIAELHPIKDMITIQISIDGSSAKTHDVQRNKTGAFNTTVLNIQKLTKLEFSVVLSMVLSNVNYQDLLDGSAFRLAEKLNVERFVITSSIVNAGNAKKNNFSTIGYNQILKVKNIVENYKPKGRTQIALTGPPALIKDKSLNDETLCRPRCRRGTNSFAVCPDGDVCLCSDFAEFDYSEYRFGNVFVDDLNQICKRMLNFQQNLKTRFLEVKGVCSVCTQLAHCGGGCRADAYSTYGDVLAPYPLCQGLYEKGYFPKECIDTGKIYKEF